MYCTNRATNPCRDGLLSIDRRLLAFLLCGRVAWLTAGRASVRRILAAQPIPPALFTVDRVVVNWYVTRGEALKIMDGLKRKSAVDIQSPKTGVSPI